MCGLTGIINFSGIEQREHLLRMNQSIHHRGPDEDGHFFSELCLLAHKRLSIIDLASGQQPMSTEDERFVIVFNGEVYNFKSIRNELEKVGVSFKTHCDTEVILKSIAYWGISAVEKLRGMFAFAIYDKSEQKVFLVRDRLGIKPLFYGYSERGDLLFASELKALTSHPDFQKSLRVEGIEEYLSLGYIPDPYSVYQKAHKLLPGHWMEIDLKSKSHRVVQYWDVSFNKQQEISEQDAITEFQTRFREAIDIRLLAEVPLGAFLSGGVDSSAVVATMAGLTDDPVNTCSIGFDVKAYDESSFADQIASQYRTNHWSKQVSSDEFDLIDQLVDLYDEPYADSSALPTYRVCQLAREKVTVALSGDGADEMLAGYRRYKFQHAEDKLRAILPDSIRKPLFSPLAKIYPKLDWAPRFLRAKSTFQSLARHSVNGYFQSVSIVGDDLRAKLLTDHYRKLSNFHYAGDLFDELADKGMAKDPMSMIQYIDLKTYLLGDILTKVDRASMAHSLEVRVPFLDHKLVEWMATLPTHLKLKNGIGKYLLKKSMENKLPHDLMYRQKMGFRVPLDQWFRGPLKERLQQLKSGALADSGYFNMTLVSEMIEQHVSARKDYSAPLWTMFMLEKFLNKQGIHE